MWRHYKAEADTSHGEMLLKVSKNLHQIALDRADPRSLTASIFILKTKGGFKEVSRTEITGKDGAPIQLAATKNVIDPREMSPEVREEFRLLLEQKVAEIEQQERDDDADEAEYAEVSDAEDDGEEE
jgi:hypothetical protein